MDPSADRLIEEYQGRIYSFASRMCRSAEDARDVLQETFLAAFRGLQDFRGEAKMSTWLFRIAANACRKMRRRRTYEPARLLSIEDVLPAPGGQILDVADAAEGPEAATLRHELQAALEASIAELPPPYRAVLILRDIEGLSTEEVAEVLALSVPNVKSRLHRARLFVRNAMIRRLPGPPS